MPKKNRVSAAERSILEDPARLKDAPAPGHKDENEFNQGVPGKGSRGRRASNPMQVFRGTIKLVFSFFPVHFTVMIACIVASSALSTLPSIFLQRTIDVCNTIDLISSWSTNAVWVILQHLGIRTLGDIIERKYELDYIAREMPDMRQFLDAMFERISELED